MSNGNIPRHGATGRFELRLPFVSDSTATYTVGAIMTFSAAEDSGISVKESIYNVAGLDTDTYIKDRDAGAVIVRLGSLSSQTITVPSTYIESFPAADSVPYNRVLVSYDLGILPDSFDIEGATQQAKDIIGDMIGADVEQAIHLTGYTGVIDVAKDRELKALRRAKESLRRSPSLQMADQLKEIEELKVKLAEAEAIITSISE